MPEPRYKTVTVLMPDRRIVREFEREELAERMQKDGSTFKWTEEKQVPTSVREAVRNMLINEGNQ